MTDKERAEAYRMAAEYLEYYKGWVSGSNKALRDKADELDPPTKIDTSLRGWVMVGIPKSSTFTARKSVMWAWKGGLNANDAHDGPNVSWEEVERYGWTVLSLIPEDIGYRVRKWDEWSEDEQSSFAQRLEMESDEYCANFAIDIATRQDDV